MNQRKIVLSLACSITCMFVILISGLFSGIIIGVLIVRAIIFACISFVAIFFVQYLYENEVVFHEDIQTGSQKDRGSTIDVVVDDNYSHDEENNEKMEGAVYQTDQNTQFPNTEDVEYNNKSKKVKIENREDTSRVNPNFVSLTQEVEKSKRILKHDPTKFGKAIKKWIQKKDE